MIGMVGLYTHVYGGGHLELDVVVQFSNGAFLTPRCRYTAHWKSHLLFKLSRSQHSRSDGVSKSPSSLCDGGQWAGGACWSEFVCCRGLQVRLKSQIHSEETCLLWGFVWVWAVAAGLNMITAADVCQAGNNDGGGSRSAVCKALTAPTFPLIPVQSTANQTNDVKQTKTRRLGASEPDQRAKLQKSVWILIKTPLCANFTSEEVLQNGT